MGDNRAVNYEQAMPEVLRALGAVHAVMDATGFDRMLHHLIQLRASQINQCAYCIRMHTREATADGETAARLERLPDWRQSADFGPREKAALAWTEALTRLPAIGDLAALRAGLRAHFSEAEIGILTATVAMINLWNRIQVSRH